MQNFSFVPRVSDEFQVTNYLAVLVYSIRNVRKEYVTQLLEFLNRFGVVLVTWLLLTVTRTIVLQQTWIQHNKTAFLTVQTVHHRERLCANTL